MTKLLKLKVLYQFSKAKEGGQLSILVNKSHKEKGKNRVFWFLTARNVVGTVLRKGKLLFLLLGILETFKKSDELDRNWHEMTGNGGNWREFTRIDRNWWELARIDGNWQKLTEIDGNWREMTGIDKYFPILTRIDKNWQELTRIDKNWQELTRIDIWIYHCTAIVPNFLEDRL